MAARRQLSSYLEEAGYLNQDVKLANKTLIHSVHITPARQALVADRDSLYKNALIAYCGVYRMILSKNYSWAFIHSYYSVFYFYQTLLAFSDFGLCYDQGKPFSIKLTEGASFNKECGNTHESILELFKNTFVSDSEICSEIAGVKVCNWFENMRNRINYRSVPQLDPFADYGIYEYNGADELRKKVSIYLEELIIYAYEPCHAYVAYPLLLIQRISKLYKEKNEFCRHINSAFLKFLNENIRDNRGPISPVVDLIKSR